MACSKYTLTNTGSSITNFSYRRCDDNMWQYQVPLDPSEVKNIWLINNSYSTAFSNAIVLVDQGAFPPLNATATPTPTPTLTPTNTPTPSITASQTPTQTQTQTQTQTPSQTQTQTPTQTTTQTSTPTQTTTTTLTASPTGTAAVTPTPTPTPGFYEFSLGFAETPNMACSATQSSYYTITSSGPVLATGEILYSNSSLTTPAPNGYYADGTDWYQVGVTGSTSGVVINKVVSGCLNLVTPTPTASVTPSITPTNTVTPSPTDPQPARYQFTPNHSESSSIEACSTVLTASLFGEEPIFSDNTFFFGCSSGLCPGVDLSGWYVVSGIVYELDASGTVLNSTLCGGTPTPTPTQTNTQTPSRTPNNSPTPTNTQTGTPAVTPTTTTTPTASSFGTNTLRVEIVNAGRARTNGYSLTQMPYDTTPGSGFTASTGTFPITAGGVVFGTHQAFSSSVFNNITFEMECDIDGELSIVLFQNGGFLRSQGPYNLVSSGPNTVTFSLSANILVTDTLYFQLS